MAIGANGRGKLMSEINVTPFVDVMLVLLIIFMITAPLLQEQISVDLPEAEAQPRDQSREAVTLTITREGALHLNGEALTLQELEEKLRAVYQARDDRTLYLYADQAVPYGTVIQAMALMQPLGLRLGMMTEPPPEERRRRR